MKTVDELMALADACIYAAHQEAAFTERYDARAALLTALQEVVQPVTAQEAGQWAVDNSDAGQMLDIATHDPIAAPKMVWIPELAAPQGAPE